MLALLCLRQLLCSFGSHHKVLFDRANVELFFDIWASGTRPERSSELQSTQTHQRQHRAHCGTAVSRALIFWQWVSILCFRQSTAVPRLSHLVFGGFVLTQFQLVRWNASAIANRRNCLHEHISRSALLIVFPLLLTWLEHREEDSSCAAS